MVEVLKLQLWQFINGKYFPYLFLSLLPFILFRPAVLGQNLFALGDFSGSDLLELHLPFKYILHESYKHGAFPLWTPYLSNGFPILAEGQSGPLYPPHILLAFLPPALGLNYSILLSFVIGGCGMYAFCRRLPRMGKLAAITSAIIFIFGSFFVARLKHINMIAVAAYLPWCLWCIRNFFVALRFRWFTVLGALWSLQVLAGHPHLFYFSLIMCSWQIIGELCFVYFGKFEESIGSTMPLLILKTITGLIVAGFLALGLSAAQLLPTYELTTLSSRQDFSYDVATAYPLRPKFLATLFAPFFLGNPATGNYRGNIQIDGIWWENVLYIGLLPFVVVLLLFFFKIKGLFSVRLHLWKSKLSTLDRYSENYFYWFYFVTILVFFVLSMGSYSFLFSIVYYNLPGMSLFRFPTRFNLMTLLSLSIMAGWGIQKVLLRLEKSRVQGNVRKEDSNDYVFSWPFTQFVTSCLVLVVLLLDFGVFADQYIAYYPVGKYLKTPQPITDLQKSDHYLYRIYPMTQYSQNPFGVLGWKKGEKAIETLQKAVPGNFSAVYHLFSFTDRGWFEGGLGLKERALLENFLIKNQLPAETIARTLGLWNVKYILSFNDFPAPEFYSQAQYTLDSSFGIPLQVHKNEKALPRAFFVSEMKKVSGTDGVLDKLIDTSLPPQQFAYSESVGKSEPGSPTAFNGVDFNSSHVVSIVDYRSTIVSMKTKSTSDAYLVFSDTYYPGWKARIDGIDSPIIKANLIMRSVKVPKGEHTVIWTYQPITFYIGCGISFATLVTLVSYLIIEHRKRRGVTVGELG